MDRCPTCDREGCRKDTDHVQRAEPVTPGLYCGCVDDCPACAAEADCNRHRVDWRARALTAESAASVPADVLADAVEIKRLVASREIFGGAKRRDRIVEIAPRLAAGVRGMVTK